MNRCLFVVVLLVSALFLAAAPALSTPAPTPVTIFRSLPLEVRWALLKRDERRLRRPALAAQMWHIARIDDVEHHVLSRAVDMLAGTSSHLVAPLLEHLPKVKKIRLSPALLQAPVLSPVPQNVVATARDFNNFYLHFVNDHATIIMSYRLSLPYLRYRFHQPELEADLTTRVTQIYCAAGAGPSRVYREMEGELLTAYRDMADLVSPDDPHVSDVAGVASPRYLIQ